MTNRTLAALRPSKPISRGSTMTRHDTRRILGPMINLARRRCDAAILVGLLRLLRRWEGR